MKMTNYGKWVGLAAGMLAGVLLWVADGLAKAPERETVQLGTGELTSGIPGDGDLTIAQIKRWLDDEKNHVPLDVKLPKGLAAGAANIKIPEDNPLTRAKVELGRQLYFDPRLSADDSVSCATCHHPSMGWTADTQFGVGIDGQEGNRNSPVSFNRILSDKQFWDGRAATLEEQAVGPIANPIEMGNTHEACVGRLAKIEGYKLQFAKVFPESGLTIDNVGKALASFERVIVTGPAAYDYYQVLRAFEGEDMEELKEDAPEEYAIYAQALAASKQKPMSESAKLGHELFFGKANCSACHAGANFTDELYHNIGVGMDADEPDLGRYVVTKKEQDKGAFKTPSLRNLTHTGPYMHDGSQKTLKEVMVFYNQGGHPNPYLSDKMKKLDLNDKEIMALVDFMKALEGDFPPVEEGRLPK